MAELPGRGSTPRRPRIGLLVNPIAGLGGRVGLKGTDGPAAARALALGAQPLAGHRAAMVLTTVAARWPVGRALPVIVTIRGAMGSDAVPAGLETRLLDDEPEDPSAGLDTTRLAAALVAVGVDVLLFAGGDGTARDVYQGLGETVTVLGLPAGVKMQSDVFAASPTAAGEVVVAWLTGRTRGTREADVLDLDEEAYRHGEVAPRLLGSLIVPAAPQVQGRKSPSPPSEATALASIAADLVDGFDVGRGYILGPGTTTRAIARQAGITKTLVGVDALLWTEAGGQLLLADARADELEALVRRQPSSIVLTPIGGQGFLLGRGNQQLSPTVLRAVGRDRLIVVATPAKLDALAGRSLLVDTGDPDLDRALAGHIQVVTGYHERTVMPVVAA